MYHLWGLRYEQFHDNDMSISSADCLCIVFIYIGAARNTLLLDIMNPPNPLQR
jgi:hypothetical protein